MQDTKQTRRMFYGYQCPFGLRLHFYVDLANSTRLWFLALYQCPFGLKLHFYYIDKNINIKEEIIVSMPSRAETPFLPVSKVINDITINPFVSMPFRAKAPFLLTTISDMYVSLNTVSMPSRACAPFLPLTCLKLTILVRFLYQCPLGLGLHFYTARQLSLLISRLSSINALSG